MGAFASWQPQYADCGIATFPVRVIGKDKKPAIRNWQRTGINASRQLALKFPDLEAFAFLAGKRNRITVLDVDTTDERVLSDALSRHGETPIIVRSGGSGHYQAWYRHNGESRQIRPDKSRPIDILGGGVVVAPPSQGSRSNYQFIQGSLAEIGRIPALRNLDEPKRAEEPAGRIGAGQREKTLWSHLMRQANHCDTKDDLMDVAFGFANDMLDRADGHAFTDAEVKAKVEHVWKETLAGNNWFGTGRRFVMQHEEMDRIIGLGSDPWFLNSYLRRRFWDDKPFHVPNPMAEEMPGGAWTRKRFAAARNVLVEIGELIEIRKASSYHGAALYQWRE